MADAELSAKIIVENGVPQAMDKAKSATVSFSKQMEDIQKKFSTGFKDIFLGFTAPMVLIQSAISFIKDAMEQARRDAKEGIDLIAQGESQYATSEETKAASFFKRKKEIDDEIKLVKAGREEITKGILENAGGQFKDFALPEKYNKQLASGTVTMGGLAKDKEVQRIALEYFNSTDAGKRILDSMGDAGKKQKDFKGPEGFSNVVGVGPNPVMEAMTAQLEEVKKTNMILERIAGSSGYTPQDFTKGANNTTASPSRSYLLTK
jgi:hypothetical protein